ncbi:MAG TPA: histidinol-phosphate transaminase [Candidatus Omnitrophota bacterium]|nr:histidinol-phosphate transaminase [Candidatus Omnitrophota bacterium]
MKNLVRKNIREVTAYVAGKPIEETRRELGLKAIIKLASNENALGPSPKAVAAIKKAAMDLNRYPDSQSFYLKKKLGRFLNVAPSNIVVGNGSDELIDIIIKTFVERDENIVTADVTFLEYTILAQVNNREVRTAPLKYFKFDLDALKKKVDAKTKLVFIANPNNPTGTYVTRFELADFMKDLPEHVLVVLDEAYETFIDVDDFPKNSENFKNKQIITMKTFSKGYGLAGVRVGYLVANSELVSYMERARQPFNVNLLAQAGAMAAIDDKKFLKKTRNVILEGKQYLYDELSKLGISYVTSVSNFILIDVGRDCVCFFKDMLKFGVIVRDMKQYNLNTFVRVTIGTKKENERFIKVLKKVVKAYAGGKA